MENEVGLIPHFSLNTIKRPYDPFPTTNGINSKKVTQEKISTFKNILKLKF